MAGLPSRRTAVIIATDLVASTRLRAEMGEQAADAWRRRHDEILGRSIGEHGGQVIKGLGDGLLAAFHGATDAIMACAAIQRTAAMYGRRHPDRPLDIRIGISGGDVSFEDADCFGIPVIEAVRLCEVARAGQILLVDLVRLMARGRAGLRLVEVGPLALKGLPEPVDVWEVGWEPSPDDTPAPMPAALATPERVGFSGRTGPLEVLRSSYRAAVEGSLQIVMIGGQPGIGKTRLAVELAREAHRDGAVVLFGRADEDIHEAFGCASEALEQLVRHTDGVTLTEHVRHHGDQLSRLVPSLSLRVPDLPPAHARDDRIATLDAMVDLLALAAVGTPTVVVLDDLQWADTSTVRLVRHLVRHALPMSVLLVGTFRSTEVPASHPLAALLSDLRPAANVRRIELDGFTVAEVEEFLTKTAAIERGEPATALAELVHRETGGNPFFVGEVVDHLAHTGSVFRYRVSPERVEPLSIGVPRGVREVIQARTSVLSPEVANALRTASVIGTEFDVSVLARVLEVPVIDTVDLLDEPVAHGLLRESGRLDHYEFSHVLVRRALYEAMAEARRVRLHLAIAQAIQAGHGADTELAHHLCASASIGEAAQVLEVVERVATSAVEAAAYEEAIHWYEQALASGGRALDASQRGRLLVSLAHPLKCLGNNDGASDRVLEAVDLARSSGDVELLCLAAIEYGGGRWRASDDTTGLQLIDQALEAVGEGPCARRAELLLRRCDWQYFEPDPAERLQVVAEAIDLAAGDDGLLLRALIARWEALRGLPEADEELTCLGPEMLRRWHHLGSQADLSGALQGATAAAWLHGDLEGVRALIDEHADHAARWRLQTELFEVHSLRACLAILLGHLDAAGFQVSQATAVLPPDWNVGLLISQRQQAWLAREQGARSKEGALLADISHGPLVAETDLLAARAAYDDGDLEEADELALAWVHETLPITPRWLIGHYLGMHSHWASRLGSRSASALYDIVLPFQGQWICARPELVHGAADLHLGRYARGAGRLDRAVAHLEAAVTDHERAGAVTLRTHAEVDLAETLAMRGGPDDGGRARLLARRAQTEAARIGLTPVADRARALSARLDPGDLPDAGSGPT